MGHSEAHPRAWMRLAALGLVLVGVFCVFFVAGGSAALQGQARVPSSSAREVQVLEQERTGVPSPVGLAFSSTSNAFYVVGAPPRFKPATAKTDVVKLTPFNLTPRSDRPGLARIPSGVAADPINMAFDTRRNRLLMLGRAGELLEVRAGSGGDLDRQSLIRRNATSFGLQSPQGMALDPVSGTLFILDATLPRIVSVEPDSAGSFKAGATSEIDLRSTGLSAVRGLAFDPVTGHLHLGSGKTLVELTQAGQVVATRDLSALPLANPGAMVFAPSGDGTDAPAEHSVYVADAGSGASSGQIIELSLAPLAAAVSDFTSSLVNTVNMGGLSPPSPDPSGITHVSAGDKLVISDGEVEETVSGITHFQGANVWELTRSGAIQRTANISSVPPTQVPMTNEPTGVAFNPSNGHYFFSDDNARRIFELNPGADGLVGTSGDTWTSFSTSGIGNGDPEGVTYATSSGRLFVADGVDREIYEYTTAGALVGQFDVQQYGVSDPETVEFNPVTGTLFVLSSGPIIVETTTSGALLQTIDVSAAGIVKPAGVAYADASDGSGVKRFYIVDRGIDNNDNPNAVDGKLYEMTTPSGGPPGNGNDPPVITSDGGGATAALSRPENSTAVTDVNATDPDAGDTITYSISGGADSARFTIDASTGVLTFATAPDFEAPTDAGGNNVYDVVVQASDGSLSDTQAIAVTVTNVAEGAPLYFSLRSAATVGGFTAENEDVLFFNGTVFSLAFDGTDVGLASFRIDAFDRVDSDTFLLSFDAAGSVPGIAGTVDDSDIVRFEATSLGDVTAGSFFLYFDGSDVGLAADAHDVDAVQLLASGQILFSTTGSVAVSGISASDEDLLSFTPTSLGDVTVGSFSLFFDGSDVGLGGSGEDVDAAALDASGKIHMSTASDFAVPGVSGDDDDVFVFTPTSLGDVTTGTYAPTFYFDGSASGFSANDVFAIDLP